MDSSSISFTALYTGHVWYANEMSESFLTSPMSHALYWAMQPVEFAARKLVGVNIEETLLQRHQILDHRLDHLIRDNGVTQVLEIACGLSPRGMQFSRRYPQVKYVEADLPGMVERKRTLLNRNAALRDKHTIVECNFFEKDTPAALNTVLREHFDQSQPIAIITEGLVNYFDLPTISSVWGKIARLTRAFPAAWYLTDLYPEAHGRAAPFVNIGARLLGQITRAEVNLHFTSDDAIEEGFRQVGFSEVTAHQPEQFYDIVPIPRSTSHSHVRVVEARV